MTADADPGAPEEQAVAAEPVPERALPAVPWPTGPKPGRREDGTMLPGVSLNPGGVPKGTLQIGGRIRKALLIGGDTENGRTVADLVAAKVAEQILADPGGITAFKWLTWLEEREQGRTPLRLQVGLDPLAAAQPPQIVQPREPQPTSGDAVALDRYLASLPPAERATTVRVLLEVQAHAPTVVRLAGDGEAERGGQAVEVPGVPAGSPGGDAA